MFLRTEEVDRSLRTNAHDNSLSVKHKQERIFADNLDTFLAAAALHESRREIVETRFSYLWLLMASPVQEIWRGLRAEPIVCSTETTQDRQLLFLRHEAMPRSEGKYERSDKKYWPPNYTEWQNGVVFIFKGGASASWFKHLCVLLDLRHK